MFKIGDKVVAKKRSAPHNPRVSKEKTCLVKANVTYTVFDVEYCVKCGKQSIDIGKKIPYALPCRTRCPNCQHVIYLNTTKWFLISTDFEKVIYNNISSEIVSKFKETKEKSDILKIQESVK